MFILPVLHVMVDGNILSMCSYTVQLLRKSSVILDIFSLILKVSQIRTTLSSYI